MINENKLLGIKKIATHANCPDGLASAMILKDVLPNAEVVFLVHDSKEHLELEASQGLLFCDFPPPKNRVEEFIETETIVLDHHKSAKDLVLSFSDLGVFADEKERPGISGANLAYEEVWLPLSKTLNTHFWAGSKDEKLRIEKFAKLAGILDTWQKQDELWDDAVLQGEVLMFYPQDYWVSTLNKNFHAPRLHSEELSVGKILIERQKVTVEKARKQAYYFNQRNLKVAVFEAGKTTSIISDHLRDNENVDIAIGFSFLKEPEKDPIMIFSCRSKPGLDISKLAKFYGGGGHTQAAGFHIILGKYSPNPYRMVRDILNDFGPNF